MMGLTIIHQIDPLHKRMQSDLAYGQAADASVRLE
jgi:hypothetical protein